MRPGRKPVLTNDQRFELSLLRTKKRDMRIQLAEMTRQISELWLKKTEMQKTLRELPTEKQLAAQLGVAENTLRRCDNVYLRQNAAGEAATS